MKKNKLGITEGDQYISSGYRVDVDRCVELSGICEMSDWMIPRQMEANANLIADAFNTANKCGLLPSELLEQRDELLMYTKSLIEYINSKRAPMTTEKQLIKRLSDTINQIEQ